MLFQQALLPLSEDINMNEETCCPTEEVQAATEITVETETDFLLNKETRSEERLAVCKECPELFGPLNNCRQCGCFMNIKTRIYSATCPLGKW
jgi:hypothetical protein